MTTCSPGSRVRIAAAALSEPSVGLDLTSSMSTLEPASSPHKPARDDIGAGDGLGGRVVKRKLRDADDGEPHLRERLRTRTAGAAQRHRGPWRNAQPGGEGSIHEKRRRGGGAGRQVPAVERPSTSASRSGPRR